MRSTNQRATCTARCGIKTLLEESESRDEEYQPTSHLHCQVCGINTLLEESESRDEEYQPTTSSSSEDETAPRSARLSASSKAPKVGLCINFVNVDLCPKKDVKFQPLKRSSWVDNMRILHHFTIFERFFDDELVSFITDHYNMYAH